MEKGTPGLVPIDGIPVPDLLPGTRLPFASRTSVPLASGARMLMGRVNLTFLTGPQVFCLSELTAWGLTC